MAGYADCNSADNLGGNPAVKLTRQVRERPPRTAFLDVLSLHIGQAAYVFLPTRPNTSDAVIVLLCPKIVLVI